MIYRIVVTILLIAAIVAVGVAMEPSSTSNLVTPAAPSVDDGAMKSLRLN